MNVVSSGNIAVSDFCDIAFISRVTFYAWKKGNNVGDKLRITLAHNVATKLQQAFSDGRLPMPSSINAQKKAVRVNYLKSMLQKAAV